MKAVGIKALKARLSEYLRAVRAGETFLVTDRNEVVAEIRPASRRTPPRDTVEEALEALAQAGDVSRARLSKRGWRWAARGLGLKAGTAQAVLDEIRADRHSS